MHHSHFNVCGMFNRTQYTWLNFSEMDTIDYVQWKKAVSCQSVTCVCVMANGRTNGLSRGFIRALCFH